MELQTMYPAGNSVLVQLTADVGAGDDEIAVTDASVFPDAPNFATIGTDNDAEVIVYQGIDTGNNKLTGCLRGQSYTLARAWGAGQFAYHAWTAQQANAIMENIKRNSSQLSNKANEIARLEQDKMSFSNLTSSLDLNDPNLPFSAAGAYKLAPKLRPKFMEEVAIEGALRIFTDWSQLIIIRKSTPNHRFMLEYSDKANLSFIFTDENEYRSTYTLNKSRFTSAGKDLGSVSDRWKDAYLQNPPSVASDERLKKDIASIAPDVALKLIMALNPVTYKLKDGTSGRTHWGFISQQVYEAMQAAGLSDMDFGGFIKSPIYPEDENGNPDESKEPIDYMYMLRYEEFIAPLIAVVQSQQKEINDLKEQVEELTEIVKTNIG